jgi:hypothetical protein
MKKSLSLLTAYILLQTQTWALSGGPDFGGDFTSFLGTYAGVLIPDVEPVVNPNQPPASASIGLFIMAQPAAGPAVGSLIVFSDGIGFNGTIDGIIDPADGELRAIVAAVSNFSIVNLVPNGMGGFTTVLTNIFAQGQIEAAVKLARGSTGSANPLLGLNNPARLEGTATIDLFATIRNNGTPNIFKSVTYTVDGFKQTDDTSTTTDFTFGGIFDPINNGTTTP